MKKTLFILMLFIATSVVVKAYDAPKQYSASTTGKHVTQTFTVRNSRAFSIPAKDDPVVVWEVIYLSPNLHFGGGNQYDKGVGCDTGHEGSYNIKATLYIEGNKVDEITFTGMFVIQRNFGSNVYTDEVVDQEQEENADRRSQD